MATEDEESIPDSGAVFTFGKSRFADNAPNRFWIRDDPVKDIACGDEHTAVITASGRLFTFGSNDWGQLGQGHTKTLLKPSCVKSFKGSSVALVACGKSHTIVALESGAVYAFGCNTNGQLGVGSNEEMEADPKPVEKLSKTLIKKISAGAAHSAAILGNGDLYVWGSNQDGQLGLDRMKEVDKPTKLKVDDRVKDVSCGYYHTALLTNSGHLYTFGEGELGKLGLGEEIEACKTPKRVKFRESIAKIRCGGKHTAFITDTGKLYVFGDGSSGQLGLGTKLTETFEPTQVDKLGGIRVKDVSVGESHTAALSETKQIYMFGDGRNGKLGLFEGNMANQFSPARISKFTTYEVVMVALGGGHTIVFAKPGRGDDKPKRRLKFAGDSESDDAHSDSGRRTSSRKSKQMEELDLARSHKLSSRDLSRDDRYNRSLPNRGSSLRDLPPLKPVRGNYPTRKTSSDDEESLKQSSYDFRNARNQKSALRDAKSNRKTSDSTDDGRKNPRTNARNGVRNPRPTNSDSGKESGSDSDSNSDKKSRNRRNIKSAKPKFKDDSETESDKTEQLSDDEKPPPKGWSKWSGMLGRKKKRNDDEDTINSSTLDGQSSSTSGRRTQTKACILL